MPRHTDQYPAVPGHLYKQAVQCRDVNKVKVKVTHVQGQGQGHVTNIKAKADSATEGLDKSQPNKILYFSVICSFLPRDAMLARYMLSSCVCLSPISHTWHR